MSPSKIPWCDDTVNPQGWGCYGPGGTPWEPKPCWYCYSRDFAARHLRECPLCRSFIPHWHPEQLAKPRRWRQPRKVFWQSMGDLFHPWTPAWQIEAVLAVVRATPQHTHIFCTKNPARYAKFNPWPGNCVLLTTITGLPQLKREESQRIGDLLLRARRWSREVIFGLSIEPLLGPINLEKVSYHLGEGSFVIGPVLGDCDGRTFSPRGANGKGINFLIIGARSGRGSKRHQPDPALVQSLIDQARAAGVPVFVKGTLFQQFPIQEWPDGI